MFGSLCSGADSLTIGRRMADGRQTVWGVGVRSGDDSLTIGHRMADGRQTVWGVGVPCAPSAARCVVWNALGFAILWNALGFAILFAYQFADK